MLNLILLCGLKLNSNCSNN